MGGSFHWYFGETTSSMDRVRGLVLPTVQTGTCTYRSYHVNYASSVGISKTIDCTLKRQRFIFCSLFQCIASKVDTALPYISPSKTSVLFEYLMRYPTTTSDDGEIAYIPDQQPRRGHQLRYRCPQSLKRGGATCFRALWTCACHSN